MLRLRSTLSKSQFFHAGIDKDTNWLQLSTGFTARSMSFRYLGIAITGHRLRCTHYTSFIKKLIDKVGLWSANSLSYAARLQLIKSVLQRVTCFWLSALPIPVKVRSLVNRICLHFLWRSSTLRIRKAWVAWSQISMPKEEGSLGVLQLKSWNLALLAKHLWDI